MTAKVQPAPNYATRWLSREFSELLARLPPTTHDDRAPPPDDREPDFDLLIVGSGYGGAIAAAQLAGRTDPKSGKALQVAVLERGREWLPGAFPGRLAEMPTAVRGSAGGMRRGGDGLFDVRMGSDVGAVLACGLGGGSLINAGVMEEPQDAVFKNAESGPSWPDAFVQNPAARKTLYSRARKELGAQLEDDRATGAPVLNTIALNAEHRREPLAKYTLHQHFFAQLPDGMLKNATGGRGRILDDSAVTIAMKDKHQSAGGVELRTCTLCGDCATGCNVGAKESLDTNLLVTAVRRGAQIFCGATVLRLQKLGKDDEPLWAVQAVHTDDKRRLREPGPAWILARRVIVAAGTYGSTEILLRSQRHPSGPRFSSWLGRHFSTNGDLLSYGLDMGKAEAMADEDKSLLNRRVGPTNTAVIRTTFGAHDAPATIEELAVPGPLRRLIEELVTTADTVHALDRKDPDTHYEGHPPHDPIAVLPALMKRTTVLAMMFDDGSKGRLRLEDGEGDARCTVDWPPQEGKSVFDIAADLLEWTAKNTRVPPARVQDDDGRRVQPRAIANPLWRLLPENMDFLVRNRRGPLLTVHPLGGCAMGRSARHGVVDTLGRVYHAPIDLPDPSADSTATWPGLVVLDGSVVPHAPATNPALTIAALALQAIDGLLLDVHWRFGDAPKLEPGPVGERPVFRTLGEIEQEISARPAAETKAQFTERLSGPIMLDGKDYWAQLTVGYAPLALANLFRPNPVSNALTDAVLQVERGQLRLYAHADWQALCKETLPPADMQARQDRLSHRYPVLSGSLTILQREARSRRTRICKGLRAWVLNRGLRDTWQEFFGPRDDRDGPPPRKPGFLTRLCGSIKLADHAAEVRRFDYVLTLGSPLPPVPDSKLGAPPKSLQNGGELCGRKRIHYARPSNPWRQLMEMHVTSLPGLAPPVPQSPGPMLKLDPAFLSRIGQPLLRLEAQRDHSEALMDVLSLAAIFGRLLLSTHIWSARKPDTPRRRHIERFPGQLPGLPRPEVREIVTDRIDGREVRIRLTRYRTAGLHQGRPVLLIPGYSTSGNCFAHPALNPSLAAFLAEAGRDVWVLDLRTSSAFDTARLPWSFEASALADIPAAVDEIFRATEQQLDVIAHCMGAAKFSMALLSANLSLREVVQRDERCSEDRFRGERAAMPGRIRRLVLSQIGPVMELSQANIFRAYLASFVEEILGPIGWDLRPGRGQGLAPELLDRLFSTVPYPDEEFLIENPAWPPWARREYTATRHRMDALYGRSFKLGPVRPYTPENGDAVGRQDGIRPGALDAIDDLFGPLNLRTVTQVIHFARLNAITNRGGRNWFVSDQSLRLLWKHIPTMAIHGEQNGLSDVRTLHRMQAILGESAGLAFEPLLIPEYGHQNWLLGPDQHRLYRILLDFLTPGT